MLHNVNDLRTRLRPEPISVRTNISVVTAAAMLALSAGTFAQKPDSREAATAAACERLAGAAREQCLRDDRRRADRAAPDRDLAGSCDSLLGPEKERCLQQGGTVEAGASPGKTARPPAIK